MPAKSVKKNLSIGKLFGIIEAMANNEGPMKLHEIASAVNQPPTTTLRFLATMMDYGYAFLNEETMQYCLTHKFCQIGDLVLNQFKIRDTARPYLEKLSAVFKESTSLAIEQNMEVVYIDVVEGPDHLLQTLQRIGKIAPMHCTGVGKCLLSQYETKKINEYFSNRKMQKITKKTIIDKESLVREIEKVKNQGYAIDDEECEIGVRCIAAPIRNYSGKVIAAISTSGPVHRMSKAKIEQMQHQLKDVSEQISNMLGFGKSNNI